MQQIEWRPGSQRIHGEHDKWLVNDAMSRTDYRMRLVALEPMLAEGQRLLAACEGAEKDGDLRSLRRDLMQELAAWQAIKGELTATGSPPSLGELHARLVAAAWFVIEGATIMRATVELEIDTGHQRHSLYQRGLGQLNMGRRLWTQTTNEIGTM